MHIKTLTISGFKSYKEAVAIDTFSPKHNVVVGRNGSGKSNFFAAIRFVLSDAYASVTAEERTSLMHEGLSSHTTLAAFVEIVFDNTDNRFPTGNPEVVLRRTIGSKKDEYTLDKKSATKADIMNLLESAGFSKSNPYYIVPQGRITTLTNAKDHERLALLKEVAGTKVYEQRRAESLRIMAETDAKRGKISELLDYIESRLTELEEEKEELKEFQDKDKERRCLEYALYQRELEEVGEALAQIENERRKEVHDANGRREMFNEREIEIQDIERQSSEVKHSLQSLAAQRHDAQSELTELTRRQAEVTCVIEDLQAAGARAGGRKESLETESKQLSRQIKEKERDLQMLMPEWEDSRNREVTEKRRLDEANARISALHAKQGRASKFKTKVERDNYLAQQITSMQAYETSQKSALQMSKTELGAARKSSGEVDAQITEVKAKIDDGRQKVTELAEDIRKLKEQHADLSEQRKDKWREDTKLESLVARASDQLRNAERDLAGMMDKDTGSGLRAIDRIAERHNLTGVYGPLYRLFEITDHKFNTAVELTAGNSLFHVVVDSDETASKVLDVMMKEKNGRVTFMPLNRLKPKNQPMPNAQDAIPLMDKLRFDPEHEVAFRQVFGKTCVCQDLTIAAAYVKSHGINTITLDGDKVDRKGALTGGFHDVRRSRIEAIKAVTTWRLKHEEDSKKSKDTKVEIAQLEQKITQISGQIAVLTGQQTQIRDSRERLQAEGTTLTREKEKLKERILKLENDVDELETELNGMGAKFDALNSELNTPLTAGLTAEEEGLVEDLGRDVEALRKTWAELTKNKSELESRKNIIEIELNEKLYRRRDEVRSKLEALQDAAGIEESTADDLDTHTRQLTALNSSIHTLTKRTQDMEKETEKLTTRSQDLQKSLDRIQAQQTEDSRNISRQQKTTERYLAKRQMLSNRKDECNRNIRDLGVLPEEAFEKYTNEKLDRLVKKLHSVNEGLKKFAHVNKKAFEQYSNFTKQRDQLLERREELDKSAESIEELVEVLDQRKDEAIERTFKQVAMNFEEVFSKLVPAGRGRLIIQRRMDQDEEADEEAEETQQSTIDNYTGISIKVSFNSKVDEGLRIQQLSGGQKSLVALATVFAIQKCDPAPFYLFDEIDANLDAQYRTAVASMIHELAESAQFITTTFRPEMLVTADKFYGVLFNNQKVSSIRSIKREEAQEFVDQEAQAQ
ncbi:RecF/RecN/SMC protein [Hymenopellis radicata]|nr:RecF/RecN/SMC protein [Hymenopellis radicata]